MQSQSSPQWSPDSIQDAITWLDSHIDFEKKSMLGPPPNANPGGRLQRLGALTELMDSPQKVFQTIHITGTNGKTSTSRMVSALLSALGFRSGQYTSPHLERLNERICLDGEPIRDEDLAEALHAVALLEPMLGDDKLGYFEIMTAAALRVFADAPIDVAAIEVGVGGTYDATNIVDGQVAVVTNIGLDHTNYLGKTHRSIAENKAGIIKPGAVAVIGDENPDLVDIWNARDAGVVAMVNRDFGVESSRVAVGGRLATLRTPTALYEDVFVSLHGGFQSDNAVVALTAVEGLLGRSLDDSVVRAAFESVRSPGRLEIIHRQPLMVVDGAHNSEGATSLKKALSEDFAAFQNRILILGMLTPHDPKDFVESLGVKDFAAVFVTAPQWPRAIAPSELGDAVRAAGGNAIESPNVEAALATALGMADDEDLILATGSLYLVGELRAEARRRFT